MIEAGEQRRLLAEIARQRDDLDVEAVGRKFARGRERGIAAAVVDIDDLGRSPRVRLEARGPPRRCARAGRRDCCRLVEQRNHDRKAGLRPAAWPCGAPVPPARVVASAAIDRAFRAVPRRRGVIAQARTAVARWPAPGRASAWTGPDVLSGAAMRLPPPLDRLQRRLAQAWHERAVSRSRRRASPWSAWSTPSSTSASSSPPTTLSQAAADPGQCARLAASPFPAPM